VDVRGAIHLKLLLDTHVLFWCLVNDPKLPERHRQCMMEDAEATFVSAVSGWEIAIKVKLGKWPEAAVLLPDLSKQIPAAGFEILPLTLPQAERAGGLDLFHRDPFDRLLAAQALDLDMVVATLDPEIARFGCKVL
jgi:PIN domain nuclease of toxin-antitoxin system